MDDQLVILAHDGSDKSDYAVEYYLDRIHKAGNKLLLVHCIELPEMRVNQAKAMHMSPGVLASMWKEEEQKTKKLEESMKALLRNRGLKGELLTTTGKPGETLCRMAEEHNAALIVTGTKAMGTFQRTIMGSYSDYVVHHAHCPVMVCRHPASIKSRHPSSGSEGGRSRNASGDSNHSFKFFGEKKKRHASAPAPENMLQRSVSTGAATVDTSGTGGDTEEAAAAGAIDKTRHVSGEKGPRSAANQRTRFGHFKFRSVSLGSDSDD